MINVHGQVVLIGLSASVKVTTRCIGFTRRPSFAEGWNHVVIVRTVNGDLTFHQITISPSHFNGTVLLTQTKVIKSLVLINQSIRCDYFGLTNSMRFKSVVKAHYCRNAYGNEYFFFCFFKNVFCCFCWISLGRKFWRVISITNDSLVNRKMMNGNQRLFTAGQWPLI